MHFSDSFFGFPQKGKSVFLFNYPGNRQKIGEMLQDTNGARSRTSAPVRSRECLMQVQVHYIDPYLTRPCYSQEGVHVGSVHINESAGVMRNIDYLSYILLE